MAHRQKNNCRCEFNEPTPAAIGVAHTLQAAKIAKMPVDMDAVEAAFPWFINSEEHNYCFWQYATTMDPEDPDSPVPDKEICNLLCIGQVELDRLYASAITKLIAAKDTKEVKEFLETVAELMAAKPDDNSVYMPSSFREKISEMEAKAEEVSAEENKPKKRGRKSNAEKAIASGFKPLKIGLGMPIHRSGTKADLYFAKKKKKDD